MLGEAGHAREHLQWRKIEVWPLAQPGVNNPVDFVTAWHSSIIVDDECDGEFAHAARCRWGNTGIPAACPTKSPSNSEDAGGTGVGG